jgi:pimeloyl-ACP methyl ester carboxylesterase
LVAPRPSCSPSGASSPTSPSPNQLADEPVSVAFEHDGLRIAALDWGGDGDVLLLLHPNGFCGGLFDPVARRLTDQFRPVAVDLRAHGATDVPAHPPGDYAFALLAGDVLAVLDAMGIDRWVALGESLGGGVAAMVDVARPGATRALMLCEAIAFDFASPPRPVVTPGAGGNTMATIARKRRAVWPDRATVLASYASRPPLDVLAPEALAAYVRWGFVDRPDGDIELACPPEAEATLFEMSSSEAGGPSAWRDLANLSATTTVLAGTESDLPTAWFEGQAERARAPFVRIDGGHFFVQEDTTRAEQLIRRHLGEPVPLD